MQNCVLHSIISIKCKNIVDHNYYENHLSIIAELGMVHSHYLFELGWIKHRVLSTPSLAHYSSKVTSQSFFHFIIQVISTKKKLCQSWIAQKTLKSRIDKAGVTKISKATNTLNGTVIWNQRVQNHL